MLPLKDYRHPRDLEIMESTAHRWLRSAPASRSWTPAFNHSSIASISVGICRLRVEPETEPYRSIGWEDAFYDMDCKIAGTRRASPGSSSISSSRACAQRDGRSDQAARVARRRFSTVVATLGAAAELSKYAPVKS
jgi:hypothetical protein